MNALKPGLYVHATRFDRAKELSAGPVYVDDTLSNPDDWYIVTPEGGGYTSTKGVPDGSDNGRRGRLR
jgi:hypothetical protein